MQPDHLPDVITIDGPAASGKSTIGLMLAQRLDYLCLDTGSMYRALTLAAILQGISPDDETRITRLASECDLDIIPLSKETDGRHYTVLLDGVDVTWDLRLPQVDAAVSQVSTFPGVRARMVERQRAVGRRGRVIMIGRDIGTVVMPDAGLKLYITASPEERARRRLIDRLRQGNDDAYQSILADVVRRDQIDGSRVHSPMRPAADAITIDTTGRDAEMVIEEIMSILNHSQPEGRA
ncbi:MAG: (d)CMP kinase [Candidatus Promineofilum sp.]|nr:(d)CMP kinase [Promineifilum sp.]